MAEQKQLNTLVINKIENEDVFNYLKTNGLIHDDELYFIEGEDSYAESDLSNVINTDFLNKGIESGLATEEYVNTNGGKIDSIKVNGTEQIITDKSVNITVPTKTSEITNDSGYVTATEMNNLVGDSPVSDQINNHNISNIAHDDIRLLITELTNKLNALADSDDDTLDQMSEVVGYIKANRNLIEGITTNKVNVADIIDNLITNVSNKPLSAAQGVALKSLIDALLNDISSHTDNATIHITDLERDKWNEASTSVSNLSVLVGDTSVSEQIDAAISDKADAATTLKGYNIEDAYTKTEVDNLLEGFSGDTSSLVDIESAQTITGEKTFTSALTVNNDITATGTITGSKVYNATWNDYAEWFEKDDINEDFKPGDICVWNRHGVIKSYIPNDSSVVGVVSDSYGHILGGRELENMEDNNNEFVPIGLKGRVKCNVIGTVNIGDLIVTSDVIGAGIVNNDAKLNMIIGKALESSSEEGLKKVIILI